MPLHLRSTQHSHEAHFPSLIFETLPPDALNHLQWRSREIAITSNTPLDAPADIWLHIPSVDLDHAAAWCASRNLPFLGPWHPAHPDANASTTPCNGFGFRVQHFSRYRYVDTDDESDADDPPSAPSATVVLTPQPDPPPAGTPTADTDSETESARLARRRARVSAAGRTPGARRASRPRPSWADPQPADFADADRETQPTARPRLATPRAFFDTDHGMGDADDGTSEGGREEEEEDETSVGEDDMDGFEEPRPHELPLHNLSPGTQLLRNARAQSARGSQLRPEKAWQPVALDPPKLQRLRAALFGELPSASPPVPYRGGMGPGGDLTRTVEDVPYFGADVKMEDVPSATKADAFEEEDRARFEDDSDSMEDADDFVPREAGDPEAAPRDATPLDGMFPSVALPFPLCADSIAARKEGVFRDTGLLLGRSTRAALHHTGLLAQTAYGDSRPGLPPAQGFCIRLDNLYATNSHVSRAWLEKVLRVHCDAWYNAHLEARRVRDDAADAVRLPGKLGAVQVPTLRDAFAMGAVADLILEQLVEEFKHCHGDGDENALHGQVAFWLLLALYKNGDGAGAEGEDTLLRRLALWAEGPAGTAFDEEIPTGANLRRSLLLLTVGNVQEAVACAIESGNLRLAMLVARALESPKDDLRSDAQEQLAAYGLLGRGDDTMLPPAEGGNPSQWDRILEECYDDSAVSVDERMILLVLAGHVAPVAHFLGLSWYRLFIMELLHGAGSSEQTQSERVSDAVDAVTRSEVRTFAPHGHSRDTDVVYHLLRLYADPTASYPLTSGVYSNGSFGVNYCPMDSRFPWLLHQVLSALIPQASTKRAPVMLADAFSSQLRSMGLPLWAFYVLCTGGASPDVLKTTLVRDWPDIVSDFVDWKCDDVESLVTRPSSNSDVELEEEPLAETNAEMGAEPFLISVLGVPVSWVHEARAVAAYSAGDYLAGCEEWISSGTEEGASFAHDLLALEVFPEIIASHETSRFESVAKLLKKLSTCQHVSNWSTAGGLILDYFDYIIGVPALKTASLDKLRDMALRVGHWSERATTPMQRHASSTVADGIATAQRVQVLRASAENRTNVLEQVVIDLERLPCSRGVKLRAAGEYKIEEEFGAAVARRFASAFPPNGRFLDTVDGAAARRNSAAMLTDTAL